MHSGTGRRKQLIGFLRRRPKCCQSHWMMLNEVGWCLNARGVRNQMHNLIPLKTRGRMGHWGYAGIVYMGFASGDI